MPPPHWSFTATARLFTSAQRGRNVPKHSWSVFHPSAAARAALHPVETLRVTRFPHLNLVQTHVNPSRFQTHLVRWGSALAVASAVYQFVTNLHTVPITGRTQVVVLSREEECELGTNAMAEILSDVKIIDGGPRERMVIDVVSRLVSVSEHLFPRGYDWRIALVDSPGSANACCAPGGKIIVYSGLLDLIDFAVDKGICNNKHDALAVVLAHEIGHALARHTAESTSYLPLIYLQAILGLESPLLQYLFEFAMNLPFSRKQEMEADHIGLMLMASACYDPREAPRVWRGFTAFFSGDTMTELEMSLDFHSTHPSNKKRERMLDALVPEALALQRRSSWCFQLKERVAELLRHGDRNADRQHQEETTFIQRLHRFRFDQEQEREAPTRRPTVGTIHELENKEVLRVLGEAHADPEAEPEEAA